jgi:hypothetical protein
MPKDETPEDVSRWFLSTVQKMWPVAAGSLSLRKSPCVRKNCQTLEFSGGFYGHGATR